MALAYNYPFSQPSPQEVTASIESVISAQKWVSVTDDQFGTVGDGVTRLVTAAQVANKVAMGFTGGTLGRLNDFDALDTTDWLGISLAAKYVAASGGGTVFIPNGHYIIQRYIYMPDNVYFVGESRDGVIIDNVLTDTSASWHDFERRCVFNGKDWKLQAVQAAAADKCTSVQITPSTTLTKGTQSIPLVSGGGATFSVGSHIVIWNTNNYVTGATVCPYQFEAHVVRAISGDTLILRRPLRYNYVTDASSVGVAVSLMGTGTGDGSFGGATYDFSQRVGVRRMTLIGAGLFTSGNGILDGQFEDLTVKCTNFKAATIPTAGVGSNLLVRCALRDMLIEGPNRGLEIKAGSSDSVFENITFYQAGATATQSSPMISIGESADNILLRNVWTYGSSFAFGTHWKVDAAERIRFEGCGSFTNTTNAILLQVVGHPSPIDKTEVELYDFVMNGIAASWVRVFICSTATVPRVLMNCEKGLVYNTFSTAVGAFYVEQCEAAIAAGVYSVAGDSLGVALGARPGNQPSLVAGLYGFTTTDLALQSAYVNTGFKRRGKPVYNITTNKPLNPAGVAASAVWRDTAGATAHTPV
jgi:hypothetical protein